MSGDGRLSFAKLKLSSDGKSADVDGQPLTADFNPENVQFDTTKAAGAVTKTLSFSVTFDYSTVDNPTSIPLPIPNPFASSSTSGGDEKKNATFPVDFFADRWPDPATDPAPPDKKSPVPKPKLCRVAWGKWLKFDCELTTLTAKYTYFSSDGVPLRVLLTLKFQEWKPPATASSTQPSSSPKGSTAPTPPAPPPATPANSPGNATAPQKT